MFNVHSVQHALDLTRKIPESPGVNNRERTGLYHLGNTGMIPFIRMAKA